MKAAACVTWLCVRLAVGSGQPDTPQGPVTCTCETAGRVNGWCDSCNVGYLASVQVHSKVLFEALDAHGHDLDVKSVRCPECKVALQTDGYCRRCKLGYVAQQAYFTRLPYELAKGKRLAAADITCETCRANSKNHGWCDKCRAGMVGAWRIDSKPSYENAAHELEILIAANEMAKKCKTCAAAMVVDGRCPACKRTYKRGKQIATK